MHIVDQISSHKAEQFRQQLSEISGAGVIPRGRQPQADLRAAVDFGVGSVTLVTVNTA